VRYLDLSRGYTVVAIVSAIMSTSDSILLGCGTVISVNLLPRVIKNPSDQLRLGVARWSVPLMAIVALYTAFNASTVISAIAIAVSVGFAMEEAEQARRLCRNRLGTRRIRDRRIPVPGDTRQFRRFLCVTRRRDCRFIADAAVGQAKASDDGGRPGLGAHRPAGYFTAIPTR
jgi:hypothetical protein